MRLFLICYLVLSLVAPVVGQDYLPLETGNFWSYVADGGVEETRVVGDKVPVFHGFPYGIEHPVSPNNQGLVNYWTAGPDGDVLLWGFYRNGWGYLYQPPIVLADAPLSLGKSWTSVVEIYSLPDTNFVQVATFNLVVHEAPELTVPAGVFSTYGIGDPDPGVKSLIDDRFTLWGTLNTNKVATVSLWYSLGVGVVQDQTDRLYKLKDYTDRPVDVEVSSWGELKVLFRGNE